MSDMRSSRIEKATATTGLGEQLVNYEAAMVWHQAARDALFIA